MTPQLILYLDSDGRVHAALPGANGARQRVEEPPEGVRLADFPTSSEFLRSLAASLLEQRYAEERVQRFPVGATTWRSREEQLRASATRATQSLLREERGSVKVRRRPSASKAGKSEKSLAELGLA